MKIPKEFNYIEAYLTLRCNFNCPYCINEEGGIKRKRKELGLEWIEGLNKFETEVPITLGGGEPTLHPNFYEIVKNIKPTLKLDLLTNLQFDVDEFIENCRGRFNSKKGAYKNIRVSYHPSQQDPNELIKKIVKLQKYFSIGLFALNHPENIEANIQMAELARKNQVYFFIKDFLGEYDGKLFGYYKYPKALDKKPKKVLCRSKEILIDPEGDFYKCHRDLYLKRNPLGNILKNYEPEYKFRLCYDFGNCNPCDVKLKTNRFLQKGNCSVEILK